MHELGALFGGAEQEFDHARVKPESLAQVLKALHEKTVSGKTAKQLLSMVFDGDARQVSQIIDEENLALQRMTDEEYHQAAQMLVDEHADMAEKVRKGQKGKIQWFVGQMMRKSQGTMDAENARRAVEDILG